ncbi:MAG: CoA-binding protein [Anaerolineae bacterium]
MLSQDELRQILQHSRTIAVYGMSRDVHKAAHRVPAVLADLGYNIIPINPYADEIMGNVAYPTLLDVPEPIDIVDVFRPSEDALRVVQEALTRREARGDVQLIWLQLGIVNERACQLAERAGVSFVQNRCMAIEVPRLLPGGLNTT